MVNTLQGHNQVFFLIGLNINNYHAHGAKTIPKLLYVDNLFRDLKLNSVCFSPLLGLFSCVSKIATLLEKSAKPTPTNRKLGFSHWWN
jgi:hypothetical protein